MRGNIEKTAEWRLKWAMKKGPLPGNPDADERYELCARFLGDAIPAESFAVGANELSGIEDNISMMEECMDNIGKWPSKDDNKNNQWAHSDWKQLAYCFVYKLFKEINRRK